MTHSFLSFPHRPFAHTFALKKQTYERFFFLRGLRPPHPPRIRCLHLQDIGGVQGAARHRTDCYQRADAVHPMGRGQHDAIQHHRPYRV